MYIDFHIRNFKCFRDFELKKLKRVNLIAGKNAAGKSALLEAIFLHCGAFNPHLTLTINSLRGVNVVKLGSSPWGETAWDSLFNDFNIERSIHIRGNNSKHGKREIKLKILKEREDLSHVKETIELSEEGQLDLQPSIGSSQVLELESSGDTGTSRHYLFTSEMVVSQSTRIPPLFPGLYLSAKSSIGGDDLERYSMLEVQGQHKRILYYLKKFEPRIKRITPVLMGSERILFADVGLKQMIPLNYISEGIAKLAKYLISIGATKGGVVLIDEIENGLHYSILKQVWKVLARAAKAYDVQVFATTHSRETVIAAHESFSEEKSYDFTYHRIDMHEGVLRLVRYDKNDLASANNADYELR